MKIAIIGYGRMGHAVESVALKRGHDIVARIDVDNRADFDSDAFASADVAIEFTNATQALENINKSWAVNIPVISGTTGWLSAETMQCLSLEASRTRNVMMHSSNFSVGVNLLFAVNRYLSRIIAPFKEYVPKINETHHIHKLDHPSGTAITLAEGILNADNKFNMWAEPQDKQGEDILSIACKREGENPGFHEIVWESPIDTITISHQARSREGFALGAVLAAEWIVRQVKGKVYSINDMFNF